MADKEATQRVIINVGYDKSNIYVFVIGEATMLIAPTLKKFVFDIIQKISGSEEHNIYINLSDCKYMDSTFIGTLIIIEKKCMDLLNKHVLLINPNAYSMEVLDQMGLLKVFTIISDFQPSVNLNVWQLEMKDMDRLENAILMFQAHEELSVINDVNRKQFSLVTQTLKEEIEKEKLKKNHPS